MAPNENRPQEPPAPAPPPQLPQTDGTGSAPATAPASPPEDQSPQQAPPASSPVGPTSANDHSMVLTIAIAAAVFLIVAAGAVYAYQHPKKKTASAVTSTQSRSTTTLPESRSRSNCIPESAAGLTKPLAETTYRDFVKAVIAQNQTCADDLSSSFFLDQAKQEFGAADGKWITAAPQGLRPIWKDISQLPATLQDASFTQSSYTRPTVLEQSSGGLKQASGDSEHPQGMTLSYPVDLSKYTGSATSKWQISISFILQSGKIQVDDLIIEPVK